MKPLLIAASSRSLTDTPLGRRDGDIEIRRVLAFPVLAALDPTRPTVIVLDRALLSTLGEDRGRLVEISRLAALVGHGDAGVHEPPADFPVDLLTSFIPGDAPAGLVVAQLRGAFRYAAVLVGERNATLQALQRYQELTDLTKIGVALSTEHDLLTLLEMILSQARRITRSDAGSLYLVDRGPAGELLPALRFKLSQNFSLPNLPLREFTVPIDSSSLAGYAATTGEPLVIADVYLLPEDATYKQNRSFDEKFGYRTKSMLVIPMKTHRGEVIGVLQLINRKQRTDALLTHPDLVEREVLSFDTRSVELVSALAAQAGVAIENRILYEDIERLFEGFVTAAVTAIEARDPTTSGHSSRVAGMTVGLAEAIDRSSHGPYRELRFTREQLREIRYAGLLHDFGKVGVREQVLVKQKKLYPADLELIRHRFAFLMRDAELEFERERNRHLLECGNDGYAERVRTLEQGLKARRLELARFLNAIVAANEPTVLPEGSFEELARVTELRYLDLDGEERPVLYQDELRFLTIRKGTLDERERLEIESHVTHTHRFLQQIPWTRELRGVPSIAYGHHEKLNGAGYPRRVAGDDIPPQTRMMTIADIYDALTATDRPYKPPLPVERALDILHMEARAGMLDRDLLTTFVEARVYELGKALAG